MDIVIVNGVGNIDVIDNDYSFYTKEQKKQEIIQQIVAMLNIRTGECVYNINFGLDHYILWDTQADTLLIREHIRNQILEFFGEYIKAILYVNMYFQGDSNDRNYRVDLEVVFFDDETIQLKGVKING